MKYVIDSQIERFLNCCISNTGTKNTIIEYFEKIYTEGYDKGYLDGYSNGMDEAERYQQEDLDMQ